jgi:general nucleoside transport system permease protein
MPKFPTLEKRKDPNDSCLSVLITTGLSIVLALVIGAFLFLPFGAEPLAAYQALFQYSLGNLQGFAFTLVKATPLIFIGLGTIIAWRTGFFYLGFEGAMLMGAGAAVWVALLVRDGQPLNGLPALLFFPLACLASFLSGGMWAALVGYLRTKFGGNEVLISLMMNYVAIFVIQYLVSGPLRAPGDLPQTPRIPAATILPFIISDTRAHAGILLAIATALVIWFVIRKTPLGYELIVTGLSLRAARYGGINIKRRLLLAAFLAGGLASFAGLVEVLGVQYRLLDGIATGTGFIGIVAALLGKLHPIGVVIASTLYAGMEVGADAMQRRAGLPSSVIFIIQSLIVLFVLASETLRYYRVRHPAKEKTSSESET